MIIIGMHGEVGYSIFTVASFLVCVEVNDWMEVGKGCSPPPCQAQSSTPPPPPPPCQPSQPLAAITHPPPIPPSLSTRTPVASIPVSRVSDMIGYVYHCRNCDVGIHWLPPRLRLDVCQPSRHHPLGMWTQHSSAYHMQDDHILARSKSQAECIPNFFSFFRTEIPLCSNDTRASLGDVTYLQKRDDTSIKAPLCRQNHLSATSQKRSFLFSADLLRKSIFLPECILRIQVNVKPISGNMVRCSKKRCLHIFPYPSHPSTYSF